MNCTLTDSQQEVVEQLAKAEMRSVSQMLALLIAEGINWTYVDYSPRYDDINTSKLKDQVLNELKNSLLFHDTYNIT